MITQSRRAQQCAFAALDCTLRTYRPTVLRLYETEAVPAHTFRHLQDADHEKYPRAPCSFVKSLVLPPTKSVARVDSGQPSDQYSHRMPMLFISGLLFTCPYAPDGTFAAASHYVAQPYGSSPPPRKNHSRTSASTGGCPVPQPSCPPPTVAPKPLLCARFHGTA